jgi:isoamylase
VTAVELMPVHHFLQDRHLVDRAGQLLGLQHARLLRPDIGTRPELSPGRGPRVQVDGPQPARRRDRGDPRRGLQPHGRRQPLGPTLSFRGIDNAAYYRWSPEIRYYMDFTGCGNTLNMSNPRVLQLIMDSLRYWITEMHVDGFRFDLASTLARELHEVDKLGAFFDIIHQDPVISQVKLIAEPWDLGEGGYQVGNFPVGLWSEWNGKYRDCVRVLEGRRRRGVGVRHAASAAAATCTSGAAAPRASINFVTCHDGFTLEDLVSYNTSTTRPTARTTATAPTTTSAGTAASKGPTDDPEDLALRERKKRNLLATLMLSQGVPMLLAGDESATPSRATTTPIARTTNMGRGSHLR